MMILPTLTLPGDAGNDLILAICCLTTATGLAGSVFASEEPDSYTLANLPARDTRTYLLDAANCFVARNTRYTTPGSCPSTVPASE